MSIVNSQITLCRFRWIKYQRHFHKAREIIDNGFWIRRCEGKKQSSLRLVNENELMNVSATFDGYFAVDAVFNFASLMFDKLSHREMNGYRLAVANATTSVRWHFFLSINAQTFDEKLPARLSPWNSQKDKSKSKTQPVIPFTSTITLINWLSNQVAWQARNN